MLVLSEKRHAPWQSARQDSFPTAHTGVGRAYQKYCNCSTKDFMRFFVRTGQVVKLEALRLEAVQYLC